jgi:hypothetical protein
MNGDYNDPCFEELLAKQNAEAGWEAGLNAAIRIVYENPFYYSRMGTSINALIDKLRDVRDKNPW